MSLLLEFDTFQDDFALGDSMAELLVERWRRL